MTQGTFRSCAIFAYDKKQANSRKQLRLLVGHSRIAWMQVLERPKIEKRKSSNLDDYEEVLAKGWNRASGTGWPACGSRT